MILYTLSSRCVINVPPDLLAGLAGEIPNVVAVKQANDEDLGPIEGLEILAGNDEVFLARWSLGAREGSWSPRTSSAREMRALYEAQAAADVAPPGPRAQRRPGADLPGIDRFQPPTPAR